MITGESSEAGGGCAEEAGLYVTTAGYRILPARYEQPLFPYIINVEGLSPLSSETAMEKFSIKQWAETMDAKLDDLDHRQDAFLRYLELRAAG